MHLPLAVFAYLFPEGLYETLWKTPKYFTVESLGLSIACILTIALGCVMASISAEKKKRLVPFGDRFLQFSAVRLKTVSFVGMALTLIGSTVWLVSALMNGFSIADLGNFLAQESAVSNHIKLDYFSTIPGITTLAQCSIAATITACLLYKAKGDSKAGIVLISILALNTVRALILSERLALIEIVVPVIVLYVHFRTRRGKISMIQRALLKLVPAFGALLLFFVFTGMEFFRSWTYYSAQNDSLLAFGAARLMGYYVTAVNNSALLLQAMPDSHLPVFTQMWLWKMPIMKDLVTDSAQVTVGNYQALLASFGNPELNNTGGFLVALYDFGTLGGLLYWFAVGIVFGKLYVSFRNSEVNGLLLYPFAYVGILELSRVLYLSDGRAFPSLVLLLVATQYLRRSRRSRLEMPRQPACSEMPVADCA